MGIIPLNPTLRSLIKNISNLYLLLTKYVNCWIIQQGSCKYEEENRQGTSGKTAVFTEAVKFSCDQQRTNFYLNFYTRWQNFIQKQNATNFTAKVEWRLVVGLGTGSVLETSITLHHILGVPYIPATALKGVLSAYYIEKNKKQLIDEINQTNQTSQTKKYKTETLSDLELFATEQDQLYIKIFGNQQKKAEVTFFDAYPTSFPKLEIDVMTPHYSEYYTDTTKPPADWQTPKPIKFLTIKKDTEFLFAFKTQDESLKNQVESLLKEALQNRGVGAKTAVGYGYFKFQEKT